MTGSAAWFRRHQRGLGWAASLTVSVALIYWLLSGFSASRFVQVLARSDPLPIAGLFAALLAEQWLRAWK
ncbi:MAG: hypothetical protein KGJ55_05820 [Gammaproteobacteria bacterium]|nr:hypothetical protein [Gammaproteobacteria bacterium]